VTAVASAYGRTRRPFVASHTTHFIVIHLDPFAIQQLEKSVREPVELGQQLAVLAQPIRFDHG